MVKSLSVYAMSYYVHFFLNLVIILALVAYLLIRMFVLKETNNNDNIVSSVNNIIPVVNNLRRD